MQNHPVHWSEGMFLRPHHFQSSDRFWAELTGAQNRFDHPCGYGLLHAEISTEALSNGLLEIVGLAARLRDGTILSKPSSQRDSLDLNIKLAGNKSGGGITVYVAIPISAEGQANVAANRGSRARHSTLSLETADEAAGGNRQEITYRVINDRLMLSSEDTSGFDLLPIARLLPASDTNRKYQLDPNYFPPCISVSAWKDLSHLLTELRSFVGNRLQYWATVIKEKGIRLSSQVQGDQEKLMLMHLLNQAFAELGCLAFAPGIHPLVAYTGLCSIAGRLAILGTDVAVEDLPKYDHDDLATIFRRVDIYIRQLINSVKDDEYIQRPFIGAGRGMHVKLEPEWFSAEWDWYFAVTPISCTVAECGGLFSEKKIAWKLGASHVVEQYMTQRQPGLKPIPVEVPRALSNHKHRLFMQIPLDTEAWKQVQLTLSMAMRVEEKQIGNLGSLEGSRRLQVNVGIQAYTLEFHVFAVRKRF
jgi:type VI secretion system protein ImpJ